jgi:uncharacterized surface protein with fasciclin (FAS1) repeats
MKKTFIKPLAIMALAATGIFGCASSEDAGDNAQDMNNNNTAVIETEAEVMEEPAVGTTDTEMLSNEEVSYDDIFSDVENSEQYDLLTLLRMDPNFSTFADLLQRSGLEASLQVADPVTILAPTNEAFAAMDSQEMESLTTSGNTTELTSFVQRHILPSKVYQSGFNTSQVMGMDTENQVEVDTRMNGEVVIIGGAQIIKSDVEASNGIIHVLDGVIQPTEIVNPGR